MHRKHSAAIPAVLLNLLGLSLGVCPDGLFAQEPKAADAPAASSGTLTGNNGAYQLTHFVAYAVKDPYEERIAVLASDKPIPLKLLKQTLLEGKGDDARLNLRQNYVKVLWTKAGEIRNAQGILDERPFSESKVQGSFKLEEGRIVGQAALVTKGKRKSDLDMKFNVAMFDPSAELAQPAAQKLGVSGVFKGNGKDARLAYVSAQRGEAFNDKPSIVLIFTEKDHSKARKPEFSAGFGDFGSALIISCHEDGGIFSCSVSHAAHTKRGFSSIGKIQLNGFDILASGQVQGELTTGGQTDTFGETWEVALKFAAKLPTAAAAPVPATPAPKTVAPAQPPKAPQPVAPVAPPKTATPTKPATPVKPAAPAQPAVTPIKAKELALPAGSTDIEYKALVKFIDFKNPGNMKTVAADFAKQLAAQGWAVAGSDVTTPLSVILRRKRGDAELTIILKPEGQGTTGQLFTKGLDWGDGE